MDLKNKETVSFIINVSFYHLITYFIFGFIASSIFHYSELFELPIISDYYKSSGSTSIFWGPFIQIIRGFLFSIVLLPLRKLIENMKHGFLFIWFLILIIGILNTPAASPGSIEGIIYTKIPLWFHLLGLPEVCCQTFIFSLLVFNKINKNALFSSVKARTIISAFSVACVSFIGYTVFSILYALSVKADINQDSASLKILGQFISPLLIIFIFTLIKKRNIWLIKHLLIWFLSGISLYIYQKFILGYANVIFVIIAPILPSILSILLTNKEFKSKEFE